MTLSYILSITVLWGFSLFVYNKWLRNNSQHKANRYFLILTFCASCLLPLAKNFSIVELDRYTSIGNAIETIHKSSESLLQKVDLFKITTASTAPLQSAQFIAYETNQTSVPTTTIALTERLGIILIGIYFIGFLLAFIKYALGLVSIWKIYKASSKLKLYDSDIAVHKLDVLPFSFFNQIYLNANTLQATGLKAIILHEQAHINERHSVDRVCMGIMKVIFWFHPMVYLYAKLMKETHEFYADQQAHGSKEEYCKELMKIMDSHSLSLANNFYGNNLKRRIDMINKKTASKRLTPYVLFMPVFICILMMISCTVEDENKMPDYVFGAILENILIDNCFDSDRITEAYSQLKETHPMHVPYMQARIQEHFEKLGGRIIFDQEEIIDHIKNFAPQGYTDSVDQLAEYVIIETIGAVNFQPTLLPVRSGDLKDVVKPGPKYYPIQKKMIPHKGIDYVVDFGKDVLAAGDGIIMTTRNYEDGYGNCIKVNHNHGMESFYAHLSEILVKEGQFVQKGEVIGKVGMSGLASKPHLHFELYRDGKLWDYDVISQSIE